MTLEGFEYYLKSNITDIVKILNGINENKANNIKRLLNRILDLFNKEIKNKQSTPNYETSLSKAVDILALHGYSELDFCMFKEDFLKWFVKNGIVSGKYRPCDITKNILDKLQTSYFMFKIDNARDPNNYDEFRKYILDGKY